MQQQKKNLDEPLAWAISNCRSEHRENFSTEARLNMAAPCVLLLASPSVL